MNTSMWLLVLTVALAVIWFAIDGWDHGYVKTFVFLLTVALAITSCSTSDWAAQQARESEANEVAKAKAAAAARLPHQIRQTVDGCTVYAFVDGDRPHYFTRCPSTTTTDSSWQTSSSCGKNCTHTETHTETIPTENTK